MFANWLLIYGQNLVIPTIVVLCELFFCWFFIFAFLFKAALGLCLLSRQYFNLCEPIAEPPDPLKPMGQ